ncbi:hypothetical protein GCM10007389_39220 [Pontibacter akesuensis]|nr:hypothetical protein GCM10007389_39220 [Pontibacter akesuensis]
MPRKIPVTSDSEPVRGTWAESESSAVPGASLLWCLYPNLERSKARGETVGVWELEDDRQLNSIACLKWLQTTAVEVWVYQV